MVNFFNNIAQVSSSLLRNPNQYQQVKSFTPSRVQSLSATLVLATLLLMLFGFVIGWMHSPAQALSASLKLPALYLLTTLVTITIFHIGLIYMGSKHSLTQLITGIANAIGLASMMLGAFAPVIFFLVLIGIEYRTLLLISIGSLAVGSFVGLKTLMNYLASLNPEMPEAGRRGLRLATVGWIFLFGFVGFQLSWVLRPFFGDPDSAFQWFRGPASDAGASAIRAILGSL